MEQGIVIAIVALAAFFILRRFNGYVKSAKMSGGGCCGSCGCHSSNKEIVNLKK